MRRVFHLSFHLINHGGRFTHLANLVHKSCRKTATFTFSHLFWSITSLYVYILCFYVYIIGMYIVWEISEKIISSLVVISRCLKIAYFTSWPSKVIPTTNVFLITIRNIYIYIYTHIWYNNNNMWYLYSALFS